MARVLRSRLLGLLILALAGAACAGTPAQFGCFSPPTLVVPTGSYLPFAVADFNGDHAPDIAMVQANVLSIALGNGDGTFKPAVNYDLPKGISNVPAIFTGDFNGDGHTDIGIYDGVFLQALPGNGDGTFQTAIITPLNAGFQKVLTGDVNGDGKTDIILLSSNQNDNPVVSIILSNGDGTFRLTQTYTLNSLFEFGLFSSADFAVGDFHNKGRLDIVVSGESTVFLTGNGDGTFQPATTISPGPSERATAVAGDFNNDGNLDIVAEGTFPGGSSFLDLMGDGAGHFSQTQPINESSLPPNPGFLMLPGDFNGDGNLDLSPQLLGTGKGLFNFFAESPYFFGTQIIAADFNKDGKLDVATNGLLGASAGIYIYFNQYCATHFGVSMPASAPAGSTVSVTVTALDPFNNVATGYPDSVTLSASPPGSGSLPPLANMVSPGVFSGSANFTLAGTDTVSAAGFNFPNVTGSGSIQILPGPATNLSVSTPAQVIGGVPFSATVSALDQYLNVATSYTGTVQFTSSDSAASLPAPYTFTSGSGMDNGVHTFSVTLNTLSPPLQTITASDGASAPGTRGQISVNNNVTVLVSSLNPAFFRHHTVTLTATVTAAGGAAGVPTGTVTFYDGATQLGQPVSLNGSGVAQMTTSSLAVGSHAITVVYSGDANFTFSRSPILLQVRAPSWRPLP